MADKSIEQLQAAERVLPEDLFVLQQSGMAKKLTGQILENWLVSFADGHGGIQSIAKQSTNGLKDTYRITLADTTTFDFIVTNGKAISSVQQTSKNVLTRTYTIAFNDGTSQTFTVTDGRSITDIAKTGTNVLTDTYTISYNDGTTSTFTVKNGKGIKAFAKVSTVGLVDTYRIEYTDNSSSEFTVTNGEKGDKGDNTYTHIKFASQEPTEASHSMGDVPDKWIGFYWGNSEEAPNDWTLYKWFKIKGEKGDTGDPAILVNSEVVYQVSDSGTIIPSGSWQTSIPVVAQGKYLWTRTTNTFNTGNPVVSYSVSRMGLDGSGSVSSVANISPDENGNVPLTAADLNALSNMGGDLMGELRMNGQPISGLNPPTEDTQAANKGYVDTAKEEAKTYTNEQVKKAAPRNLLDNSDWRVKANIVNQRGKDTYTGGSTTTYTIDRWCVGNSQSVVTLSDDGYLIFSCLAGNANAYPKQQLENMGGKTVTGAICLSDGSIYIVNAVMPSTAPSALTGIAVGDVGSDGAKLTIACEKGSLTLRFQLTIPTGKSLYAKWAALYEGEYTIDTLPEYQPKGYGAELAECQQYAIRIGGAFRYRTVQVAANIVDFAIPLPTTMLRVPDVDFNAITIYGLENGTMTAQTGFSFATEIFHESGFIIRATKANHGLKDAILGFALNTIVTADL